LRSRVRTAAAVGTCGRTDVPPPGCTGREKAVLYRRILRHVLVFALVCLCLVSAGGVALLGPWQGTLLEVPKAWATEDLLPGAVPDREFDAFFTRSEGGWTGGDGTYSVLLPDGRTVWLFGDTFLGTLGPDRSRSPDRPLVHNSFVVQQGSSFVTLHGGTAKQPKDLVRPKGDDLDWYWPGDGTLEDGALRVFLHAFRQMGPGQWDWKWEGTRVGTFSLPGLVFEGAFSVGGPRGLMFGAAILEEDAHVYIYAVEDLTDRKYCHVARCPPGGLAGRWEFLTPEGWRVAPAASKRVLVGTANQFSVLRVNGGYVLITMDARGPFSPDIVAYRSSSPTGPWTGPVRIYRAPEAGGDIVCYNAVAHPQFTRRGRLLISYNVNSLSGQPSSHHDADNYRPRFIRVPVDRLVER